MTKQIADEASELWEAAYLAWDNCTIMQYDAADQAAAAVITAKLAEKNAEIARLSEALRYYGHQFCELGESHECCGRLSEDECSGCFARQTLTRKEA